MPTVDVPSTTCASWRRLYRFGKDGKALVGVPSEALQFSNECLVAYCSAEWCDHHAGALLDCSKHDLGSRTYISTCSLISVEHQSWHRIQQRVGAISFIRLLAVVLPVLIIYRGAWSRRRKLCLVMRLRHLGYGPPGKPVILTTLWIQRRSKSFITVSEHSSLFAYFP